ncbi:probable methyltransferase PMT2, partial [Tanacetum coccineum]
METCITAGGSNGDVTQYKPFLEMLYGIPPRIARRYCDIMDMNAGLGGFAAALESLKLWVMNIVLTLAETNTLGVIYECGLIGIYHD